MRVCLCVRERECARACITVIYACVRVHHCSGASNLALFEAQNCGQLAGI